MTPSERKAVYLEYLKMKIDEEDWHGVADCAMDLREIEVEIRGAPRLSATVQNPYPHWPENS